MENITNAELATVILRATAQELGKELIRGNLERSRLMRFLRSERLKNGDTGYAEVKLKVDGAAFQGEATNDWESDIY